jgi:hypothetical protein
MNCTTPSRRNWLSSDEEQTYFKRVAFEPTNWSQSPYGDEGGGFWAVAADDNRVLWYNDIEDGFNVSTCAEWGTIPADEYWCGIARIERLWRPGFRYLTTHQGPQSELQLVHVMPTKLDQKHRPSHRRIELCSMSSRVSLARPCGLRP